MSMFNTHDAPENQLEEAVDLVGELPGAPDSRLLQPPRSCEPADAILEAPQVAFPPTPSLAFIGTTLQQTVKYVEAAKAHKAQCAELYEQANSMYEVTSRRCQDLRRQKANEDELTVFDQYVVRLQMEIDSINEDLDKLIKKPKYQSFLTSSRTSRMLDAHRDKLNDYSKFISKATVRGLQGFGESFIQYMLPEDPDCHAQAMETLEWHMAFWKQIEEDLHSGVQQWRLDKVRLLLYRTRHNVSDSGVVLPIATRNGKIERLGNYPIHISSTHDIWKGSWLKEYDVALKVYRTTRGALTDRERMHIDRQNVVWRNINHPNVLSLLGVCTVEKNPNRDSLLYFVSSWLPNSDAPAYLRKNPDADRMRIVHDMAIGLKYLHSLNIVHGGLKGSNVLISGNGSAVLSDFKMSRFFDGQTMFEEGEEPQMSLRWAPPEALNFGRMSPSSDIYSFALTALQLLSDQIPHYTINVLSKLLVMIAAGSTMPACTDYPSNWFDVRIWSLFDKCWRFNPEERCGIDEVLTEVEAIRREQYGWDGTVIIQEGWNEDGLKLPEVRERATFLRRILG